MLNKSNKIELIPFPKPSSSYRISQACSLLKDDSAIELVGEGAVKEKPISFSRPRFELNFNAFSSVSKLLSGKSSAWVENFVSGASASLLSKLILQPFDTTRTILQGSSAIRGDYSNLGECLVGMVRKHGFLSLYRGFVGSIVVSVPSSAIFFSSYEHFSNALTAMSANPNLHFSIPSPIIPMVSSSLGNFVSSLVRSPPEIVKQRVQAGLYDNMWNATVSMVKEEGVLGFFTGYSTMLSRDIPYAATQFTVFEYLKKRRNKMILNLRKVKRKHFKFGRHENNVDKNFHRENNDNNNHNLDSNISNVQSISAHEILLSNICIGAFAGLCASVVTSPMDVVKTRVMTQQVYATSEYIGMRQMFLRVLAEEGIRGFGRGLAPRILYKVPSSAVFLVCYEGSKQIFQKIRESQKLWRNKDNLVARN